jgi:hypothetical protein
VLVVSQPLGKPQMPNTHALQLWLVLVLARPAVTCASLLEVKVVQACASAFWCPKAKAAPTTASRMDERVRKTDTDQRSSAQPLHTSVGAAHIAFTGWRRAAACPPPR